MVLDVPTASFNAPVSVRHEREDLPDEDDPELEWDDWDESADEAETEGEELTS